MDAISAETHSPGAPRYYQAAERVGAGLFFWLPFLGVAGAAVLGAIYAFFEYLIGEVMEERGWLFWLPPLFALGLAATAQLICRLGKVRMRRLRKPIALLVGALGFYASWQIYLNCGNADSFTSIFTSWTRSPLGLVRAVVELAAYRGWSSWFWWSLEAVTLYLFIVYFTGELDSEIPFCERCGEWTKEVSSFEMNDKGIDSAAEQLMRGRLEGLATLGRRNQVSDSYALVRVSQCPCLASRYVCIERASIKPGTKGKWHFGRYTPGGGSTFHYHFGTGKSTEFTPIITNMEIDDEIQQKLSALELNLIKEK